jgi:proteasome assembly chaperone (PAC2) family protein
MEANQLTFREQPELRQPDLVTAFAGWSDAAQAATGTVAYLVRRLDAKRFAEIKAEEFYDFSSLRPMVTVDKGLITSLNMPRSSFFYWQNQTTNHDLVLLHGIEPQLHWQGFVDLILDLADQLNIHRIYAVGGLYDRIPHTREPRISGLVNEPSLMDMLEKHNIEPIVYQGPSSLHALLMTEGVQRKTEVISLWGHAPFYVRAESNPMVCLALLRKLTGLLEIQIDLEELNNAGEYLQQMLIRLLAESDELSQYVKKLEEQYDLEGTAPAVPLEDANRIVKEVEDFLRNERHKGETS